MVANWEVHELDLTGICQPLQTLCSGIRDDGDDTMTHATYQKIATPSGP